MCRAFRRLPVRLPRREVALERLFHRLLLGSPCEREVVRCLRRGPIRLRCDLTRRFCVIPLLFAKVKFVPGWILGPAAATVCFLFLLLVGRRLLRDKGGLFFVSATLGQGRERLLAGLPLFWRTERGPALYGVFPFQSLLLRQWDRGDTFG